MLFHVNGDGSKEPGEGNYDGEAEIGRRKLGRSCRTVIFLEAKAAHIKWNNFAWTHLWRI